MNLLIIERELEQNAKNCRVLQFKVCKNLKLKNSNLQSQLRKSERQRDQLLTEKNLLANKLKKVGEKDDEQSYISEYENCTDGDEVVEPIATKRQIKDLESELRIAKEVSVRLHGELEMSEVLHGRN